jgi:hypothetical protein
MRRPISADRMSSIDAMNRLVLAAWKHGDTVKTLELGGQVVRTSVVPELISSLERPV